MSAQDGRSVVLRLPTGSGWRMRSAGATLELEPSVYLGQPGQVRRSHQIVLTGRAESGYTAAKWQMPSMESRSSNDGEGVRLMGWGHGSGGDIGCVISVVLGAP